MKIIFCLLVLISLTPFLAFAAGETCLSPGSGLCNAIPGITTVEGLIIRVFTWIGTVVATIAMVMIIYSGARMIFSQGDPQTVGQAKTSMTYAIVGLVTVMFAYVIVSAVQYTIGAQEGSSTSFFFNPLRDGNLRSFVENTVRYLLGIIGVISVLYMIINGFRYLTAGGNDEQLKKAKSGLTWAVAGLVIILLSYTIISVVVKTF